MTDNTSDNDKILREILAILKKANSEEERAAGKSKSVFKQHLKDFNSSTPIMILNTATTIGNLVSLILGSEIIFGELTVDQKFAREVAIFTIVGLLLASWAAVGCHQLWRKFKEPPPDSNVSNTSIEKDKPLVVPSVA